MKKIGEKLHDHPLLSCFLGCCLGALLLPPAFRLVAVPVILFAVRHPWETPVILVSGWVAGEIVWQILPLAKRIWRAREKLKD